MEAPVEVLPRTQCLKVEYLRQAYGPGINLRIWLNNEKNVYVGRHGRIFIDGEIFRYPDSKWANPYKVGTGPGKYSLADSLNLYYQHLIQTGLMNQILELEGKVLGCFCEAASITPATTLDCHAKILAAFYRQVKHLHSQIIPIAQQPQIARGAVFVGRRIYEGPKFTDPDLPGCFPVIVMTASTAYGSLSPYETKDDKGRITECVFQFCKVYERVPYSKQYASRYDRTVIWEHPEEQHLQINADGSMAILPAYLAWRQKGMNAPCPIRYPVGFNHRHLCRFSLAEDAQGNIDPRPLDYISSRKAIYIPHYSQAVVKRPQFAELQQRVQSGQNLLIIEVDGPHQESLPYYQQKYQVPGDFIVNDCLRATPANLDIVLNDPKHPYGHGYVLASLLM